MSLSVMIQRRNMSLLHGNLKHESSPWKLPEKLGPKEGKVSEQYQISSIVFYFRYLQYAPQNQTENKENELPVKKKMTEILDKSVEGCALYNM